MIRFKLNGRDIEVNLDPEMPLLWALRDHFKLVGAKFGCGKAICGACTVHLNNQPVRSCVMPLSIVNGGEVTTIEGLSSDAHESLHPVQRAWMELDVPQCGYCQSGQIMSAAALLMRNPNPSEEEVKRAMSGNLCRCGTYPRILKAVTRASELCRNALPTDKSRNCGKLGKG